jgi:hypothetical protein
VEADRSVAITAEDVPCQASRPPTAGRPDVADRHSVCAAIRHPLEHAAPGDALWLHHGLLAESAYLAKRDMAAATLGTVGQVLRCQRYRLITLHHRFFLHSSGRVRARAGLYPTHRDHPGSKHHVITNAHGVPLTPIGVNCNDVTQMIRLAEAIPPIQGKHERPLYKSTLATGDRDYDRDTLRKRASRCWYSTVDHSLRRTPWKWPGQNGPSHRAHDRLAILPPGAFAPSVSPLFTRSSHGRLRHHLLMTTLTATI